MGNMNRRTCEAFPVISGALASGANSLVLYDARGHGASRGWERFACIQQFHWRSLAVDMLAVAARHRTAAGGSLLGGYSMGASSALWAAYLCPTAVRGLVLLSVTTAWEIRAARRGRLLENAQLLESSNQPAARVVRGAAFSDLPLLDDLKGADLRMPVFLAAARDDATHPAEVVERLGTVLPSSETFITETTDELHRDYPAALRDWLRRYLLCRNQARWKDMSRRTRG